ncbi:MAG: DUF11 domain-containing protein [Proteobacteria bacterium]|nr:DUF11 domain-containing protein [Pseudomonadota bacterium]MBU1717177.1 DUF11 domain-containing protein [Pseudomonadota bacterium]
MFRNRSSASLQIAAFLLFLMNTPAFAGTLGGEPGDFGNPGPTFTVSAVGSNTVTGTIGPTGGGDSQDNFKVSIPSSFQVTSISYSGPGGGNYSFNLVGCGLTGTSNLNQNFNPAQSNCTLDYYISANFAASATAWTVTANIIATPNILPTDIALSNSSVSPTAGVNAVVGTFSTTDANSSDTHTYTLVTGTGATNNGLFNISGATLRANNASTMAEGPYSIRVRTTDQAGGFYEEQMSISVSAYPGVTGNYPTDNAYSKITNLTFGSINNNSDSPVNNTYYSDYTAQSTTVNQGSGYPININLGGSDTSHTYIKVYVDWDQNGVFTDNAVEATVINADTGASITPTNPYTGTINVPAGATSGNTRMRVMIDWQVAPDANGNIDYGEAEDYTVQVSTPAVIPTVTTQAVSAIGTTTATGNGNVTNLGAPNPTAYGVCWNSTGTPSLADTCTNSGAKGTTGAFTGAMTALTPNTTYYVRAYATNTTGTGYGGQVSFATDPLLPDLTVTKTESIDPVIAGSGAGNLVYVVTVTNQGTAAATGVTLSEAITLPAGVTINSITPSGTGSYAPANSANGTWIIGNLGIAASATLTVSLTAGSTSASGANVISDTATVTALNETDSNSGNNSVTVSTSISREIDLAVSKTESIDPVVAGSGANNLVYVVTVTNNGPSDATGVNILEDMTLPTGVTRSSVIASTGSFIDTIAPDGTWTLNLASGASATLTVTLSAGSSSASGTNVITNTATVTTANEALINTGNDAATISTSITRNIDLVVSKTESVDPVVAGSGAGNLVYVVTVTNNGPSDATGINIVEDLTLPADVTRDSVVASAGSFADTTAPDGTWTLNLAAGASATLTVTLTAGGASALGTNVITNTATVNTANEALINIGNDSTTISTSIEREVDLVVTKTENIDPVVAGSGAGNLVYVVTATNNGPSDATGINILEDMTLPPGVTRVSVVASAGSFVDTTAPDGTWTLNLAAGANATMTVTLTAGGTSSTGTDVISNTATVTALNETDSNSGNDSATISTSITRQVDLVVTKTESIDPVIAGSGTGNLVYLVTVTNNGPSDATGINILEDMTLPAGVTRVSVVASAGSFIDTTAPDGTWSLDLAAGTNATLTVTLTAGGASISGADLISNTATVTAVNETDSNNGNDSVTISTSIARQVDLVVTKTENVDPVIAGSGPGNMVYVVTVINNGPSDATGINILEDMTLPAGVTRVSVVASSGSFIDTTAPDGTWSLDLASGANATLTVTLTAGGASISGADLISNTATVTAVNETDTNNANDSVTISTSITRQVDLVVTKTESVDPVIGGSGTGNLVYVVTVTNNGPSDATGINILEDLTLPAGVTRISVVPSMGSFVDTTPPDGTWTLNLVSGTSATLTVTLKVTGSASFGTNIISGTATVTAANETLINPGDDSATVSTSIKVSTQVIVVSEPNPSIDGESVTFTATVANGATGTIAFTEGATPYCSSIPLTLASQASCTISTLSVGSHTITATYSGDGNYIGNTGKVIHTVNIIDTDGDGIADHNDICPNDPDNDTDGDGICGDVDAFPLDSALFEPGINQVFFSRIDGDATWSNIVDGKPKLEVIFRFTAIVDDPATESVWLMLNGYPEKMDCGPQPVNFSTPTECTFDTLLGPAGIYSYQIEIRGSAIYDPSISPLAKSFEQPGPIIELLNGPNMIGFAKPLSVVHLNNPFSAWGISRIIEWISNGLSTSGNNGYFETYTNTWYNSPGRGYFVHRGNRASLPDMSGLPDYTDPELTVSLSPGWNIITNPYGGQVQIRNIMVQRNEDPPVSWLDASSSGLVINSIYFYLGDDWGKVYSFESAGGSPEAQLVPWRGYWVYVVQNDADYKLIIPKPEGEN